MANYYGQYPEIYSTDDARYTFFYDNGERVTLIAGENGATEEWIHALKLEHRKEYNMMRRGNAGTRGGATDTEATMLSLDQYLDEAGYEGKAFQDENSDVEANYIAKIEAAETRVRIKRVLASLTPAQRELLIRVRVKGISIMAIAADEGVARQAIQNRLGKIEKKILKVDAERGCV